MAVESEIIQSRIDIKSRSSVIYLSSTQMWFEKDPRGPNGNAKNAIRLSAKTVSSGVESQVFFDVEGNEPCKFNFEDGRKGTTSVYPRVLKR